MTCWMLEWPCSFSMWVYPMDLSRSMGLVLASKKNNVNSLCTIVISLFLWQLSLKLVWLVPYGGEGFWLCGNRGVRLPAYITEDEEAEKWEGWWPAGIHLPHFLFRLELQLTRWPSPLDDAALFWFASHLIFPRNDPIATYKGMPK